MEIMFKYTVHCAIFLSRSQGYLIIFLFLSIELKFLHGEEFL